MHVQTNEIPQSMFSLADVCRKHRVLSALSQSLPHIIKITLGWESPTISAEVAKHETLNPEPWCRVYCLGRMGGGRTAVERQSAPWSTVLPQTSPKLKP